MALLFRQIWTLTAKNLRIVLRRHWFSTPLRAVLLPILIVLLLSFTKNFLFPSSHYGLGHSRAIRPPSQILGATTGERDRVVFVNGGFTSGDIDKVIAEVSYPLMTSGINVTTISSEEELQTTCTSTMRGTSNCIAAAVFHSSPQEGDSGVWSYTIRADGALGTAVDIGSDNNDAQVYILPLQRAIDSSIIRSTRDSNTNTSSEPLQEFPITSKTEEQRQTDNRIRYMDMITNALAAPFYLSIACIIYHMTGFIATERETGMSQLLDTMMPNRQRWQPPIARIASYHIAFDVVYAPSWIATGAIIGARCFPKTSIIIPLAFHVFAGASTSSLAILAGGFFRKSQLSGIVSIIASLLLAIAAQLTRNSGTAVVTVLSLLFPPMNYVYNLILMARWEAENRAVNLFESSPRSSFAVPAAAFFGFSVVHTVIYPILGAIIEQRLYGTNSSTRRTAISQSHVAVDLNGFTKEYSPGWISIMLRWWTKRPVDTIRAVDRLSLQAWRGEILVLLGANGSGKSTTLDAISGHHAASEGDISINYLDPSEGFGYCPQKNILWDELTVQEHVKIFDEIKSMKSAARSEIDALVQSCGLPDKATSQSRSLSGGQKRKLQMAMMFAGGSTVCCIDEVSSGVDPISRRKLWDILLSKRGHCSIILTTHFLDEADILADRISILSKGSLQASGTSAELKHRLGSGYRVHLHCLPGSDMPAIYNDILHTKQGHELVYFPGTSVDTHRLLRRLTQDGIDNYEIKGPTLEDVFFKVEEDASAAHARHASSESVTPLVTGPEDKSNPVLGLQKGRTVGVAQQLMVLIRKRFIIFQRNPSPHIAALAVSIIAAGCSTLFLQNILIGSCNTEGSITSGEGQPSTAASTYKLVAGPQSQLSEAVLERISNAPPGSVTMVETLAQFHSEVNSRFTILTPGGFFLGDNPIIAWRADGPPVFAHIVQNIVNNLISNVTISSDYKALDIPFASDIGGILLFVVYFGLSMAVYPAFLALYPTLERLSGVRSMQYSNGVRALPLWLAYLAFDFIFIAIISIVSVTIFGATTDFFYAMEYLLLIFLLYGIASTLYSYVVALFANSQLAAFAITAATQAAMFLIYFLVFMVIFTYIDGSRQTSTLNIVYYSLGVVSPVVSLSRALHLTVNVFGIACKDKKLPQYPGAIDLYGGPIMYLVLQSIVLFIVLFCKETGVTLPSWSKRGSRTLTGEDIIELEAPGEFASAAKPTDGLRVLKLRKKFKNHVAVDDVTFGVPRNECFALVGPNGAGKSTTISMIRGDLRTSTSSEIFIEGISTRYHPGKARSRLGVCPQIDPLENMTVIEHLRFYARIRGIKRPLENVEIVLKAVGLQQFGDRIATSLSGGNKRKLSLGIALAGDPSVLLLDEPSSGMDALSKRIMWKTLASLTSGRSLLLTTHSMEEADALATRAGVLAGRMLALGTTEQLKARYANAHYVHLVHRRAPHTSPAEMDVIITWVKQEFSGAIFEETISYGQVRFKLPLRGPRTSTSLAEIFEKLEYAKAAVHIEYYSVSTATLDQIFLDVVGSHRAEE